MSKNPSYLSVMNGGIKKDDHVDITSHLSDNKNNGGNDNMDRDKYVTHEELKISNLELRADMNKQFQDLRDDMNRNFAKIDNQFEQVNTKFEQVNTKFEKQKVWFYGTGIAIVTATCTIVGFLLKFIH